VREEGHTGTESGAAKVTNVGDNVEELVGALLSGGKGAAVLLALVIGAVNIGHRATLEGLLGAAIAMDLNLRAKGDESGASIGNLRRGRRG